MDNRNPAQWWQDSTLECGIANVLDQHLLYQCNTSHRKIAVFEHALLGWVLAIDDVVQAAQYAPTQRELLVHIPLLGRHRDRANVLIIGGGSGELLHEVLRHTWIQRVVVVEQDDELITIAKARFGYNHSFNDLRVELRLGDQQNTLGEIRNSHERFDVVFLDDFISDWSSLLHADGVAVQWQTLILSSHGIYGAQPSSAHSEQYLILNPLRPGGMVAAFLYRTDCHSYTQPQRTYNGEHYNGAVHRAAFALPSWWQKDAHLINHDLPSHPTELWYEHTQGTGISQTLPMCRIHQQRSPFQNIEYYQHEIFGRVFVLDDTVQGSHADEYIYHEMAVHVPLLGRDWNQVRVLIVGGGDGGIVRELLKHDIVSQIIMVEIDREVIDSANQYFNIQGNYDDPRVKLYIGDAADYVTQTAATDQRFELIIVDATDSTEPSDSLWNDAFFAHLATCLSDDGVCLDSDILIHGKTTRMSRDLQGTALRDLKRAQQFFASTESYLTKIPLFPGGHFVLLLYSKDGHSYAEPQRDYTGRHYNSAMHEAAFALPTWWQALIDNICQD